MSLTTVEYEIVNPSAVVIPRGRVRAYLVGDGDLDEGGTALGLVTVRTLTDGSFTIPLIPNSEYQANDTYYRLIIDRPGDAIRAEYTIVVPVSGEPVSLWDVRVDPATLNPAPAVLPSYYLARTERGAVGGVAPLDVAGMVPEEFLPAGSGGGVSSIAAADSTIVVAGTASAPTVRVGTVPQSLVTGLTDALASKEAAGTAATVIGAHAGGDPHPQYVTVAELNEAITAHSGTDSHPGYLTQVEADGIYAPIGGSGGFDQRAARYGCIAVTMAPTELNQSATQELRIVQDRQLVYRLAVPDGTLITGVRLPVAGLTSTNGQLIAVVYNEDYSILGTSGNAAALMSSGTVPAWRNIPLTTPALLEGDTLYVSLLNTVPSGESLQVMFSDVDNPTIPTWLFDGAAFYLNDVTAVADPLNPALGSPYYDIIIGVY